MLMLLIAVIGLLNFPLLEAFGIFELPPAPIWFKELPELIFPIMPSTIPPLTPPGTYTSYQVGPVCTPSGDILSPTRAEQVQAIIQSAIASGKKVKAFGQRHSTTDIICTDFHGIAIDMSSFKGIRMNSDNSVTAGAGVLIRELGDFLHANGRALQVTPAYGGITTGGALGTAAHGSSLKYEASLSGQTVGVKIVDGKGEIQIITSREELKSFRVHLGLLGVILEVTMITVPDFKMTVHNYETSDIILTNGEWETMARASDSFFLYWFPSVGTVIVSNGTFVPIKTSGNCWSNDHVPPTSDTFNIFATMGLEIAQQLESDTKMFFFERFMQKTLTVLVPDFVPIYTDDGITLQNPGTGYPHNMMDAVCIKDKRCAWLHHPYNLTFLDNEISMDVKDMSSFITTVKDILSKSPAAFVLQGILMRFSKGTDSYMSNANGRDSVNFEFYPIKRKNVYAHQMHGITAYQVMMQTFVFNYGGRSHWGKTGMFYHSREIIQKKINPQSLKAFIAQMKRTDSNQLFLNNFGRRLLNISDTMDMDPKTKHCALLDNCICSSNIDCANGNTCGTIPGYPNFPACKTTGIISDLIRKLPK